MGVTRPWHLAVLLLCLAPFVIAVALGIRCGAGRRGGKPDA
jgi:hypothetical protein